MFAKKIAGFICRFSVKNVSSSSCSVAGFGDIPSPKGLPLVGTTFSLLATGGPKKIHKYIDRRHKELGPIFKDNVGPVTAVFLADPDEMRAVFIKEGKHPQHLKPEAWLLYNQKHNYSRGLFFMDGEEWLHFRSIMNKLLLKGDLSWISESCDVATNLLINRINTQTNREFQNIDEELYKWSMDVIISVLVGARNYEQCHRDIEESVQRLASKVHLIFETSTKLQILPAQLAMKFNLSKWRNFEKSVEDSLDAVNNLLDLISTNSLREGDGLLRRMTDENVGDKDINRIIVDLILSAGDTTAYTMAWLLYLISMHKEKQTELREHLKTDQKTPLLRNFVKETLRLYPVAPFLTRILSEDTTICGYHIPAHTLIVMSIYTSGRNEKYFKNPDLFLPERWARGRRDDLSLQQASLPFGIGARSCIGRKIAEIQLQMTISKIIQTFQVDILNGSDIEDILKMVSKPSKPLRLVFTKIP